MWPYISRQDGPAAQEPFPTLFRSEVLDSFSTPAARRAQTILELKISRTTVPLIRAIRPEEKLCTDTIRSPAIPSTQLFCLGSDRGVAHGMGNNEDQNVPRAPDDLSGASSVPSNPAARRRHWLRKTEPAATLPGRRPRGGQEIPRVLLWSPSHRSLLCVSIVRFSFYRDAVLRNLSCVPCRNLDKSSF